MTPSHCDKITLDFKGNFCLFFNFGPRKRGENPGIGPNRGRERVQRKKLCRTGPSAARTEDFKTKKKRYRFFKGKNEVSPGIKILKGNFVTVAGVTMDVSFLKEWA